MWKYEYGPFDRLPVYDERHNRERLLDAVERMGKAGRKTAIAILEDIKNENDDETYV